MIRVLRKLAGIREVKYLAVLFSAIFLSFFLAVYAPGVPVGRYVSFACFLVLGGALVYAKGRFLPAEPFQKAFPPALAAAVLTLIVFQGFLLPRNLNLTVTLRGEGAGEVCFSDLLLDGVDSPISQVKVTKNDGWEYRGEYDNYVIYPTGDGAENRLTMRFSAKDVKTVDMVFVTAPWAGSVSITTPTGGTASLNLWAAEDTRLHFPIDLTPLYEYTFFELCVYNLGAAIALIFLWSLLLYGLGLVYKAKPRPTVLALLALSWLLLFFTSERIAPTFFTRLVLILLTAASSLCLLSGKARGLLEKYRTPGKTAVIALVALYASFASFGQRFFLDGNTRMHYSPDGLLYLSLGTLWFIPIIYLLLLGLELLASAQKPRREAPYRRLVFWSLLGIMVLCQLILLWAFWPGGFVGDCYYQMKQAVGISPLNDWHPVLHTLLYRAILNICPHAGALPAVQMFFFALLFTHFLMLGYDNGVSFKFLAGLGVVFSLLPNQVISGICPIKDYSYTLALLWGVYLLVRLVLDPEILQKWWFLIAMPVDMFLIYGLRHNGIVPFIALLLLFTWITVRRFKEVKLSLTAISLASLLLVAVYKGPVFTLLDVSLEPRMSPYTTMLCAAASCVNKDLPLSEESSAIMEKVLPLDQWGGYYDRYRGHDPYYWDRGDLAAEHPFTPNLITAEEAFTVYLEALRKYPDVVIKDRLDGMDLLWDVRQPSDGFNQKSLNYVYISSSKLEGILGYFPPELRSLSDGELYRNPSPLCQMYNETLNTNANSLSDMLLWRSGPYVILLMVLALFWWGNRMKSLLWASVPLLGNMAGLVLVLYHQSFRYVYAVQLIAVALAFGTVCLRNRELCPAPAEEIPQPAPIPETAGAVYDEAPASSRMDRIAVLIPCYNECRTIGKVVDDFRRELPEAVVYVYDNNSTDGSAEIARAHGAVVRRERRQGKGNVIRRMFREIDAEVYLMVDADDTYPAENAREMAEAVLRRQADMVIGDRLSSTYFQENKRPFHNFGNDLVRSGINILFKSGVKDIMTGYRAFSFQFVKTFPVLSKGFEIETEMTIHAIDKNMRLENVVVDYRDRLEDSESKLDTVSNGVKVLRTILRLFQTYRPQLFFCGIAAVLMALALVFFVPILFLYSKTGQVPNLPTLIVCGFTAIAAIQSFFAGMILETINRKNRQDFELELLRARRLRQELLAEDRRED